MSTPKLGDGILAAQTSTSIVAGSSFEAVTLGATHVAFGSRLCENVLEPRMRRIAFSISFSRQSWKVQLVFTSTKSRRNFYTQVERQSFNTAWVRLGPRAASELGPLFPCRTYSAPVGMSQPRGAANSLATRSPRRRWLMGPCQGRPAKQISTAIGRRRVLPSVPC